jgi:hypothetical protein
MLRVFLGTDTKKARAALLLALKPFAGSVVRITDAHAPADFDAALSQGVSMFAQKRAVVVDGLWGSEEMRARLCEALPHLAQSADSYFVIETKVDAEGKRMLQKHAEVETFDAPKKKEYPTVFALADAMKRGDKKNLWIGYRRELAAGNAPEAIHGVLFWGAKQLLLNARSDKERARGKSLVAKLAELPHESRRRGEDLEYALERFMLS